MLEVVLGFVARATAEGNRHCWLLAWMLGGYLAGLGWTDEPSGGTRWDFSPEEASSVPGFIAQGTVERDQAGPRPPAFPDFDDDNTAVRFDGNGGYLVVPDAGPDSRFDFGLGDALTLEAWVKLDKFQEGVPMYIVGKGRTHATGFPRDNQNWAMRLTVRDGRAYLGFLFATLQTDSAITGQDHWHRWTAERGFEARSGWHHLAVAYRFGEPTSIRGWLDGQVVSGKWDMGGATVAAPVVDDDAVWIGSSQGGAAGSSFGGWLDAVAIHRKVLDDKTLASRFHRDEAAAAIAKRPETMPDLGDLPAGRVLWTLSEGLPTHERWLQADESWPVESLRWTTDAFLLPRIPLRYDAWGIRDAWKAPVLLRGAADVMLPEGDLRFLVRARGLGRLWVDGLLVARTEAHGKQPPNGEEEMTPHAEPPFPGARRAGYRQQEVFGSLAPAENGAQGTGRHRVVWELVLGGKNLRTESGELCVGWQRPGDLPFWLLSADQPGPSAVDNEGGSKKENSGNIFPITDAVLGPWLAEIEGELQLLDRQQRRSAAAAHDEFWGQRHRLAREWAERHPGPAIPEAPSGAIHPIDRWVEAKIERAWVDSRAVDPAASRYFQEKIEPILQEHCQRCHGEKAQGGLQLHRLDSALRGGDSGTPGIVPGRPEASELMLRVRSEDEAVRMPPTGPALAPGQIALLEAWIAGGAVWPGEQVRAEEVQLAELCRDEEFLRRVFLDTVGVPPSLDEYTQFRAEVAEAVTASQQAAVRTRWIDRLLEDPRWADHWMGFWQDLLAENPTLLNASLNSTGPFRWFLHEALQDNKPLDRLVSELLMLRGGAHEGGSAGFGLAGENDSPMAAKGIILASAFLGVEMQCARCHDSPYHRTTQRDLYSLAAMMGRKPLTVPATSRVLAAFFEKQARQSLIQVTLNVDEPVVPQWPFAEETGLEDDAELDGLLLDPKDSRERLAALVTSPKNQRFAQVMINRWWKELMGVGLVEPTHDWEGRQASHPEILEWLSRQLLLEGYDGKAILRSMMTSRLYQQVASERNLNAAPEKRFFAAPERRRMSAEQVVDSLHLVTGYPIDTEELTFVHDGRRALSNRQTLGKPSRAWMFASLNNERDRPSLALPRAQTVVDVLEAFGWSGSRQKAVTAREAEANVLQPGALANSSLTMALTRVRAGSELSRMARHARSPEELAEQLVMRILTRRPTVAERQLFSQALGENFEQRLVHEVDRDSPSIEPELPLVTWFNHLRPEANSIQIEQERRVRLGPAPDPLFQPAWREVYEDIVWSLVNDSSFVWIP